MKQLFQSLNEIINKSSRTKTLVTVLMVLVVFVTTYILILPAFTLTQEKAEQQGGIDVPASEQTDDAEGAKDTADESSAGDKETEVITEDESNKASADEPKETNAEKAAEESKQEETDAETDAGTPADAAALTDPLTFEGEGFTIAVDDKKSVLPENTELVAAELLEKPEEGTKAERKEAEEAYKKYYDLAQEAVKDEEGVDNARTISFVKFYDISLQADGEDVQPDKPVNVTISYDKEQQKELKVDEKKNVKIIHFAEDEKTDKLTAEVLDAKENNIQVDTDRKDQLQSAEFDADRFSVYAVVYTVDFHWAVEGKTFDFSIPGGGYISITDLIETLGVAKKDSEDANNEATGKSVREFVEEIEKVEFSDPELVWVGKVDNKSTVGELKEANSLEVEYSADLTEEQIEETNAKNVEAGDWALISKKPFDSTETLTITMKDGEKFKIRVTDAQISTNVLTADGKTYKITVTYDDDAKIPDGTELVVKEIPQDSDEYIQHLGQTWMEINKEYFEVEELRKNYTEDMGFLPEVDLKNLDSARFFDIRLLYGNKEIEPAEAVHVEISLVEGLKAEDNATAGIAHFSDEGLEIIDDVETEKEDSSVICFSYDQNSFSDTGTFVSHETHDIGMTAASKLTNSFDALQAGNEDSGSDELAKPQADKTLTPNENASGQKDGTYTLTLSVSGTSKKNSYSDVNKSNVLIVMDRSSSMTSNYTYLKYEGAHDTNLDYYGIVNGSYVPLNYYNGQYTYQNYIWPYTHNYNGTLYVRKTRLAAEQDALASLIKQLTDKNKPGQTVTDENGNMISLEDIIEVKLISFASGRTDKDKANGFERNNNAVTHEGTFANTESGWGTTYSDGGTLKNAVTDNSVAKGTNWEEAMEYAKEVADAKKAAQPDEPVYVIFLTDGEPTDIHGDNGNAQWYTDNEKCLKAAEPDAKAIVDAHNVTTTDGKTVSTDHKFYGIFTYGDTDTMKSYLRRLVNYAYGKGDVGTSNITGGTADYYFDADSTSALLNAFQHIMSQVSESVAYGKVSITDGLTTDAMTTTLVHGQAEGYKYTVTGPLGELYSVTAKSPGAGQTDPTVTFSVNGHDYPGTKKTTIIDGISYDYWSYTIGEGENAVEYKMTLADVSTDGMLTWDLTGIGTLIDGYTYNASFVVWPDQDAYDYVSALNNGLSKIVNSKGEEVEVVWDDNSAVETDKGYKKRGVEKYPSIVKYDNGTFAVLTNTDQQVHYSIVETKEEDGVTTTTYAGPYSDTLPTPEPMPLTASASAIEKVWNVDRDPDVLARLLYGIPGHPENPYSISFEILQDENKTPYTTVSLGWDNEKQEYIWNTDDLIYVKWNDSEGKYVQCSKDDEGALSIGTHWAKEFSIATGLILSEARMTALGLDKTAYKSTEYSGTNYYLLEEGHDYTINEPNVGYEFDFEAPVYHPMLVDGVLQNVDLAIVRDTSGKIVSFSMKGISPIDVAEGGRSALTIYNTLRGYIHLNKIVVDKDNNQLPKDDTKFEYTITLNNEAPVFKDDSIPWYGINGLFYHDENFNYYQAEKGPSAGTLTLKDEQGHTYNATCQDAFNPDIVGPTQVKYTDNSGNEKTIQLYGNQMTAADGNDNDGYKKTSTTLKINQSEVVNIANVPVNSTYEITEIQSAGYDLVSVTKKVGTGASESSKALTVSGTIVTNTDNNITYRNRRDKADLEIYKVDKASLDQETKTYLKDAEFTITQLDENGTGDYKLDPESTATPKDLYYQKAFATDENGKITISGLAPGYYEIKETDAPAGYTITDQIEYIKVENGVIKRLSKVEDNPETDAIEGAVTEWPENNDNSGMFRFTAATDSEKASFMVGNEPGAELPYTGGIGTTIFYIFGAVLVVGCSVVLAARRRLKKTN